MNEPQDSQLEQQDTEKWYTPLTRNTPFSKYFAMVLFVVLPFVGFWVGVEYRQCVQQSNTKVSEVRPLQIYTSSTPTVDVHIAHLDDAILERVREERGLQSAELVGDAYIDSVTGNTYVVIRGFKEGLGDGDSLTTELQAEETLYMQEPDGGLVQVQTISGNVDRCVYYDSPQRCTSAYACGCKQGFDIKSGFNFSPDGRHVVYHIAKSDGYLTRGPLYVYDVLNKTYVAFTQSVSEDIEAGVDDVYWVPVGDDYRLVLMSHYIQMVGFGYSGVFISKEGDIGQLSLVYTHDRYPFMPEVTRIEDGKLWFAIDEDEFFVDVKKSSVSQDVVVPPH